MLRRPFIDHSVLTVDDQTTLGVFDPTIDTITTSNSNDRWGSYEDQAVLWEYVVPDNMVIAVKQLQVVCTTDALWDKHALFSSPDTPTILGTALWKVDGTTVWEQKIMSRPPGEVGLNASYQGGPCSVDMPARPRIPRFPGGLQFDVGQVLSVVWTPRTDLVDDPNGITPSMIRTDVHGVGTASGEFVHAENVFHPLDSSASQTAFSYTVPAGGFTAKLWTVQGRRAHNIFSARTELRINDAQVAVLGHIRGTMQKVHPFISIPLGGMEFSAGTRFTLLGSTWSDHGGKIQCNLVGSQRSVAGLSRGRRNG